MSDNAEPARAAATAKPVAKRLGRGLGALLGEVQREEPLVALPSVAQSRLCSQPATLTVGSPPPITPIDRPVMLATLCS